MNLLYNIFLLYHGLNIKLKNECISLSVSLVTSEFIPNVGPRDEFTTIESHPYHIKILDSNLNLCEGSIISKNYVITAAFHIYGRIPEKLSVRAGTSYSSKGGSNHQVESFVVHEHFGTLNNFPFYDIAVLKVKQPFIFNDSIQPSSLFEGPAKPGTASVLTSWTYGNEQLKKVTVPIFSPKICKEVHSEAFTHVLTGFVQEGQLCAGYLGVEKRDTCIGREGSPLTIDGKLVGIFSRGWYCPSIKYPVVFTEVAFFLDWIKNNTDI